jgi:hypothetical protein
VPNAAASDEAVAAAAPAAAPAALASRGDGEVVPEPQAGLGGSGDAGLLAPADGSAGALADAETRRASVSAAELLLPHDAQGTQPLTLNLDEDLEEEDLEALAHDAMEVDGQEGEETPREDQGVLGAGEVVAAEDAALGEKSIAGSAAGAALLPGQPAVLGQEHRDSDQQAAVPSSQDQDQSPLADPMQSADQSPLVSPMRSAEGPRPASPPSATHIHSMGTPSTLICVASLADGLLPVAGTAAGAATATPEQLPSEIQPAGAAATGVTTNSGIALRVGSSEPHSQVPSLDPHGTFVPATHSPPDSTQQDGPQQHSRRAGPETGGDEGVVGQEEGEEEDSEDVTEGVAEGSGEVDGEDDEGEVVVATAVTAAATTTIPTVGARLARGQAPARPPLPPAAAVAAPATGPSRGPMHPGQAGQQQPQQHQAGRGSGASSGRVAAMAAAGVGGVHHPVPLPLPFGSQAGTQTDPEALPLGKRPAPAPGKQ